MSDIPPQYQPQEHEPAIYKKWENSGAFTANPTSRKPSFTISMPPPNATGELHLGHALFLSIQDILIRYHRLLGEEALWVPGTDHAAMATESVVIRHLQQQGIANPRQELGRKELVRRITQYVEDSRNTIRSQIRSMGASCDWSRERYTLEPALSRIVALTFKRMYDDGLIYRGHRIVNWDSLLQTTVSDDEVEHREEKTPLYKLKYGPFEISTARPETKFGDKYVVMHPDDKRYQKYRHGDTFKAEWINGPVTATVIKDKSADPGFGTGVMTITPWHDATDFDIAERHGLDKEQIISFDGKLLPVAGEFSGLPIAAARPKIVAKLKEKDLLLAVDEDYVHNLAVNSRGQGIIEPQIKLQWFINVDKKAATWRGQKMSLKEIMLSVVRSGDIKILPPRFQKIYFHWIDNLHDWCISRQIWWGHRIPVWYKKDQVHVGDAPRGQGWQQDNDTLDTWFSSALWTWSTLIDKDLAADPSKSLSDLLKQSPDYQKFHPTTIMETGHDILFFWVARMILVTAYITGQVPFKDVYLHGLIATKTGKKMSKSNPASIVDPRQTIKEFGSDATRFGLIYQLTYDSQVVTFDQEPIKAARNFANKVWNLARFLQSLPEQGGVTIADRWIEQRSQRVAAAVTALLNQYKLGEAARALYEFVWNDFADWYVEILKVKGSTKVAKQVFVNTLKLLHPFLPHLTELLWEHFGESGQLITGTWPTTGAGKTGAGKTPGVNGKTPGVKEAPAMSHFQDIVTTVRSARALLGIPPRSIIKLYIKKPTALNEALEKLCRAELVNAPAKSMKQFPLSGGEAVFISAQEINKNTIKQARQKLVDQKKQLDKFIKQQTKTLSTMRGKAPDDIISAKEAAITQAKLKIKEIAKSKKLL